MFSPKTTARVVGILFILASAAAIVGGSLILPISDSDSLTEVASAGSQIVAGVLFEVVLAVSVIGIAVLLFPLLRRQNEALALGYVAARTVEAVLVLAASTGALVVLTLSRDFGGSTADGFEPLTDVVVAARDWAYLIGTMTAFSISALLLYTLLLRSRLVPTWLSLWGLVGGALLLIESVLELFDLNPPVALQAVLVAPIAINEMVLAVWLIVKGFDITAMAASADDPRAGG